MNRLIAVEEWVGETRAAIVENGRVVELHFERWSEIGQRAFVGELYRGRVRKIDPGLNAAFVDLGRGEPGFLPFGKAGRPQGLHEGTAIGVRVAREAFAEKGPTLALAKIADGDAPEPIEADAKLAERLVRRYSEAEVVWADEARVDVQAAIDEALLVEVPIRGGGRLSFEPTKALTAIDIDSGSRTVTTGRKLALEQNLAAMPEIARHLRLRGLSGNIVIDCLHLRAQPDRKAVEGGLKRALKPDPARIDLLPISRFGLIEILRQRTSRSINEIYQDDSGKIATETLALTALRRLQNEAMANRASKLALSIASEVYGWLKTDPIGWIDAMTDRIGPRFDVNDAANAARDSIDVKTV